jgi:hypothetical protein
MRPQETIPLTSPNLLTASLSGRLGIAVLAALLLWAAVQWAL